MTPRNWDGATVDRSVLNRLRRLDPKLKVTFSPYALDPVTGNPIVGHEESLDPDDNFFTGKPVSDPAFYLWRQHDDYGYVLVQIYPVSKGFGNLEVLKLEADLSRFHSPAEAWRIVHGKTERLRQNKIKHEQSELTAKALDNKKLIRDAAAGGDDFFLRQPKAYGYSNQNTRVSTGESGPLKKSSRELGLT